MASLPGMSADSVAEYPEGVSGQVWDRASDGPVQVGRIELRIGDEPVASADIGADGTFGIETGPDRLLAPGLYELVVQVPGFVPARRQVEVKPDVPSCRVGRIDLEPVQ